jgi:hypothetical protein
LGLKEERAAPRRTGPLHLVGARGRVVCLFGFFRGCWGLLMPDNGGCTASAAADLFSSFKRREPLRGERVHIAWLGPGAGWLVLMPDNGGGTAGAAADLFSSFYLCGDSDNQY